MKTMPNLGLWKEFDICPVGEDTKTRIRMDEVCGYGPGKESGSTRVLLTGGHIVDIKLEYRDFTKVVISVTEEEIFFLQRSSRVAENL